MKTVKGNLLKMAQAGDFDVIVHGCNCHNVMGAGIARQIAEAWPVVPAADSLTERGDINKLGTILPVKVRLDNGADLIVANAYTQYDYGTDKMNVDYDAIRLCFRKIGKKYGQAGLKIGYPQIGCGLAGGDWKVVSEIIREELGDDTDHTYVEYDPKG